MTVTYLVGDNIYINLTNRCTSACTFCIRNFGDGAYGSDSLWLEREPTVGEIMDSLTQYDMAKYNEIVFCGYGEPTIRLDELLESAKLIKELYNKPIRVNTNGHANLIHKKDVTSLFAGLVDTMSISLNTPDAKSYQELCLSEFGEASFEALIDFGKRCLAHVPQVIFSVVRQTLTAEQLEKCAQIAKEAGVTLRIRELAD